MKAIEYLKSLPRSWLPRSIKGGNLSNTELNNALRNKSVFINGMYPGPLGEVDLPVYQLQFFPKSKNRRTTYIEENMLMPKKKRLLVPKVWF